MIRPIGRDLAGRSASELAAGVSAAQLSTMPYMPEDVSPDVALLQVRRYREMTAAEKLAIADSIWDLAWDATKAGVRMRRPDYDEAAVTRAARTAIGRAAN